MVNQKHKPFLFYAVFLLLAVFTFNTQFAHAKHRTGGSIADAVAKSGGEFDQNENDFDILLNAVIAANLVDALAASGADLTVFAPTDKAFIALPVILAQM